jgi:formylglycine-generating enzyme required for sulfatase activity
MIIETIGWWLFGKACTTAWGELAVGRIKGRDEEGRQRQRFVSALREAVDDALQALDAPGVCLPASARDKIGLFFDTIEQAGGKRGEVDPRLILQLGQEDVDQLLAPLQRLFSEASAGTDIAGRLAASIDELLRVHARIACSTAEQAAIRLFCSAFVDAFEHRLRQAFPEATGLAALDGISKAVDQSRDRLVTELRQQSELLAGRRLLAPAGSFDEVELQLTTHAAQQLRGPLESELQARISELMIQLTGSGRLPSIRQTYVRSAIKSSGRQEAPLDELQEELDGRQTDNEPETEVVDDHQHAEVPALADLLFHRVITIIGEPGAGKSIELRRLAGHLCEQVTDAGARIVPVYVNLSVGWQGQSVIDLLRHNLEPIPQLLSTALAGACGLRLLLLLDGFDEVEQADGRRLTTDLVTQALARYQGLSVVLAGRPQAAGCWQALDGIEHAAFELKALDLTQQLRLVARLGEQMPMSRFDELRERIEHGSESVQELLGRPLYLMAAVVLAASGQPLHADAAGLIGSFLKRLARASVLRLDLAPGSQSSLINGLLDACEHLAGQGRWTHQPTLQPFDSVELLRCCPEQVPMLLGEPAQALGRLGELMEASGIFQRTRYQRCLFSVFPFQEYFTARGLARRLREQGVEPFMSELRKAAWTQELPRQLAAATTSDPDVGFPDAPGVRLDLLRALYHELLAALDGEQTGEQHETYLTLVLNLQQELLEQGGETLPEKALADAGDLAARLVGDPRWRQVADSPDALTVIGWASERATVAKQMRSAPGADELEQRLRCQEQGREWVVKETVADGADRLNMRAAVGEGEGGEVWHLVPPGPFIAGGWADTVEMPVRVEQTDHPFWISRDPVTVGEYVRFVGDGYNLEDEWWTPFRSEAEKALARYGGRPLREPYGWERQVEKVSQPATGVSWFEAVAYCRWLNHERTGSCNGPYRLPSEAEWERSARGLDGRLWPWGSWWRPELVVCREEGSLSREIAAVNHNDQNLSLFGARGMAGNVWEWTASRWQERAFGDVVVDAAALAEATEDDLYVLRGGSFVIDRGVVRCVCRNGNYAGVGFNYAGFRCVRDV